MQDTSKSSSSSTCLLDQLNKKEQPVSSSGPLSLSRKVSLSRASRCVRESGQKFDQVIPEFERPFNFSHPVKLCTTKKLYNCKYHFYIHVLRKCTSYTVLSANVDQRLSSLQNINAEAVVQVIRIKKLITNTTDFLYHHFLPTSVMRNINGKVRRIYMLISIRA